MPAVIGSCCSVRMCCLPYRLVSAGMGGIMCQTYIDSASSLVPHAPFLRTPKPSAALSPHQVLHDAMGASKESAATLSGAFPLGMIIAVGVVARFYDRQAPQQQAPGPPYPS